MKNLHLWELFTKRAPFVGAAGAFAQTPTAIYYTNPSLYKFDFNSNQNIEVCPQDFGDVIHIQLLQIEGKVCVVSKTHLYIIDPDGSREVISVVFDSPIGAISWNPTEELIVVVEDGGSVRCFSVDYEEGEVFAQGESSLGAQIPDTVYVGWGSKDTQFRGSEGKLKDKTPIETQPVTCQTPTVTWRGNGEMFAINYFHEHKRKFVVFGTPCKALYRSEECPGLQTPIAWRPTGNMIATLKQVSKTQSIVIFEKNGQQRFNFELNLGEGLVKSLKWSPCAQILAVHSETSTNQSIALMTSSNYQWYTKQTLKFTPSNPLVHFHWLESTQATVNLSVITHIDVIRYTFNFQVTRSTNATCASIDGVTLKLSEFADVIIPPIQASKTLTNQNAINFAILNPPYVILIDDNNQLALYDLSKSDQSCIALIGLEALIGREVSYPLAYHHFIAHNELIYFAVRIDSTTEFYNLNPITSDFNFIGESTDLIQNLTVCPVKDVHGLVPLGGDLYSNHIDLTSLSIQQSVKLMDDISYNCQLTSNCHFYVNDTKVSDSVSSFLVFDDYLLFTTKFNQLFCVRFGDDSMAALLAGKWGQLYKRSIEQGANLITATPKSPTVILQMPRGNLETISCRLISIDILDAFLSVGQWEEAIRLIRLEKLNGNLLFDLNPKRFLDHIAQLISALSTITELNNYCLEIEESNVLGTMYKNCVQKTDNFPHKVRAIFDAILNYFEIVGYVPYISTIMIINLHYYSLKEALLYVQDLIRFDRKMASAAILTLKTYGCDQDKLYTESLLLYDTDLAHFVASSCQMDPRIYEPHLDNLKNLTEIERRYQINVYTKNPKTAIQYLLRMPQITSSDISQFITNQSVALEAYTSCPKQSEHYRTVSTEYANHLSRQGNHHEAAIVYQRAKLIAPAMEEFKMALKWREVLNLAKELQIEGVQLAVLIKELGVALTQRHEVRDAAILYEFYGNDYQTSVKILLENGFYEEAVHVARQHNRPDMIVGEILPSLLSHKSVLTERLEELEVTFKKHKDRLIEVRKLKGARFNNMTFDGDDGRDDLFSEVGSTISTRSSKSWRSRSSTASSRNRRKEMKKKQDLREGGAYEDIALVRAIHGLISEFHRKEAEVKSCCEFLMQESEVSYREIREFYELWKRVEVGINEGVALVWPPHFHMFHQTQDVQELADLENLEHLDVEFRTAPLQTSTFKWVLFQGV